MGSQDGKLYNEYYISLLIWYYVNVAQSHHSSMLWPRDFLSNHITIEYPTQTKLHPIIIIDCNSIILKNNLYYQEHNNVLCIIAIQQDV